MSHASNVNADLEAMYRAATIDIPEKSSTLSSMASELMSITSTLNTQSALCSDPPSMVDLLQTHDLLYEALRRCVLTMNDCSEALIAVAQDFAAADQTAAGELENLKATLPGLGIGQPAPQTTPPPVMDNAGDINAPGVTYR